MSEHELYRQAPIIQLGEIVHREYHGGDPIPHQRLSRISNWFSDPDSNFRVTTLLVFVRFTPAVDPRSDPVLVHQHVRTGCVGNSWVQFLTLPEGVYTAVTCFNVDHDDRGLNLYSSYYRGLPDPKPDHCYALAPL